MTIELEITAIKNRLDELSQSFNTDDHKKNGDLEYIQLMNELSCISEELLKKSQINLITPIKTSIHKLEANNTPDDSLQTEANILNAIMENTHAHLAYLDSNLNFLRVNEAYIKGSGFSREALIGKNHFQLFPNNENEKIFRSVVQTGKPVFFHARPFENKELPESGTTYWDWSLVPTLDKNGLVNGLVFSLLDVTDFERIKMQLEEEQERLNIILRNIPTGIIIIDENKKKIKINKAGQEIVNVFAKKKIKSDFEYSFNSWMGSRILEVTSPLNRTTHEGNIVKNRQIKFTDIYQNEIILSVYSAPLTNKKSEIYGSVSAFQDITERLLLEKKLNERNFDLSQLNRMGRDLSTSLNLQDVINNLVAGIQELIRCSGCTVWLVDDQHSDRLVCVGSFNSGEINLINRKISSNENLIGWVARQGKSALVNNVLEDDRFTIHFSNMVNFPIRSLIAVPLLSAEGSIGVLEAFNDTINTFNAHDQVLLEMLSNNAVIAIENAAFYKHAQEAAAAEERAHLARELHDAVSQTLFSTSIIAESLPRLWDKNPERVRQGLDQLHLLTKSALAEMRTLLMELRPQFLSETNLNELLLQLTESYQNRSNLKIYYKNNCDPNLPKTVQIVLYRIAQEALQNVIKHANADFVEIFLDYNPTRTILTIKDDGIGYNPEQIVAGHMGVEIMRERANNAKISLNIESSIGNGTNITAVWNNSNGEVGND